MESQLGVRASILEKDVWLCLVLENFFQLQDAKPMAFKSGTSLSKVYQAIERFSEDIDVTIDWTALSSSPTQKNAIDGNDIRDKMRVFCPAVTEQVEYVPTERSN